MTPNLFIINILMVSVVDELKTPHKLWKAG